MNISSPVASEIASVNFTFLSTEDIQNVSVKQIINPMTFENTIPGKIPVPMAGGLYDPALGASDGLRQRCATCFLDYKYCPGHLGHIGLPVPVYHPLFFDQMLRLLRSTCVFCFHFRISQLEVNRVVCKLQLIQYGLLVEAQELDDMFTTKATSKKKRVKSRNGSEEEGPGDEIETEDEDDMDEFMERRRTFVDRAIRKNKKRVGDWSQGKILSVAEERRELIKTFMGDLIRPKKCNRCKGASPEFRVDNYSKIFEKPLPKKAKDSNYLLGLRRRNTALDRKNSPEGIQQGKKYSSDAMDIDEGISVEIEEDEEDEDEDEEETKTTETAEQKGAAGRLMTSIETLNTLTRLFENEKDIAQLLYQPRFAGSKNSKPVTPQMFFLHSIAVPPTKFRPPQVAGGEVTEASSNKPLVKILQDCLYIRDRKELYSRPGETHESKQSMMRVLIGAFVTLQESVNTFLDSTKSPITGNAAKSIEEGIKQKLEKKEGLFRKNMMGKRVNFAARSVISPDPNIETREIGVPPVFACKLTYPEPVTEINHQHMMELVINGPDKWPGAVAIENENGSVQKLPTDKESSGKAKRQQLAQTLLTPDPLSLSDSRPKKVHRHLRDGDVVLMNRQPTLHKPSIMGHIAKVLPKERTIRMHYANCNTYNADFDGDEMNMHLPQNEVARAEAQEIANTDSQYLVATSGKPLRGLIQDHLVMGVWLTNRDTMFTRDEYQQLVYSCLLPEQNSIFFGKSSNRIETIPPAIIKPRPLWTGKQIITTILENIRPKYFAGLTLNSTSKTPGDSWDKGSEEGKVIFHDGYFACGILDKNQLGPTEFGFVHSIYEIYGGSVAGSLLTILGRLLTKFLHMRAHTCGMDDLLLTPQGDARRRKELSGSKEVGRSLSAEYVSLKKDDCQEAELNLRMEEVLRDEEKHRTLDLKANAQTKDFTSAVISECLPSGLQKHFPHNNFQAMTVSGAKGSNVNATQISCLLGQQVLEGRRVPVMVSGKTLPCFKPFETDVRAGGYVTDRFLTGIRPQEYFFHCMAGREGLIDTAVKTSRSGYLQRCLIKGMEGIQVAYDNTVRDSDGSLVQFLYGEDGLDVVRQKHLHQFKFLAQNMKSILRKLSDDLVSEDLGDRLSELSEKLNVDVAAHERVKKAMKKYHKKKDLGASEVTMSELNPSRYVGSVSEKFAQAREKYIKDNPDKLIVSAKVSQKDRKMVGQELSQGLGKTEFRNLMDLKYLRSIIDPGEAVGIIAGQSVGEPSTQMTLNTFHLAGHATKNVTLGIPRLREIVMTASASIRTPTMTLTLNPDVSDEEAEVFTKRCSKLTLSEVIDGVTITEVLTRSSKTYKIRLDLFSRDDYSQEYSLTQSRVHNVLRNKFLSLLEGTIIKALNAKGRKSKESIGKDDAMPDVGESAGRIEEAAKDNTGEGAGDDSDDDDGDATNAKQARNKTEAVSYEAPDEDEEEIHRKGLVEESATENEDEDEGLGASTKGGDTENSGESDKEPRKAEGSKKKSTVETTKLGSNNVVRFEFDENDGQWCEIDLEYPSEAPKVLMLGIVERVCRDTIIHQLPSIGAIVKVPHSELEPEDQKAGKKKLAVEGVNFHAFWDEQDTVDSDTMETNDIAAFLKYYGVEAARNNIVKEMNSVFKGHGISVDLRHLNLIADIMTRGGGYTPFNRQGLRTSVSPFLKMSFETTCNFLRDAVLEGDFDDMTSPSSRIVMGKLSGVGSGSFDVMVGGLRAESYV